MPRRALKMVSSTRTASSILRAAKRIRRPSPATLSATLTRTPPVRPSIRRSRSPISSRSCCSSSSRGEDAPPRATRSKMQKVDEHALEEGRLGAGRRRGARYEIDQLAVLHAVIGDALDLFVLGEIDRKDPLVGDLWRHELYAAIGDLANVIPGVATDGGRRRRRPQKDQDLLRGSPGLDLFGRFRVELIPMDDLTVIAEAAAEPQRKRRRQGQFHAARCPGVTTPGPRPHKLHSARLRVAHFLRSTILPGQANAMMQ